ncbi:MAG: DUF2249 domain-containing protein [Gemmatimonadales bacterium]
MTSPDGMTLPEFDPSTIVDLDVRDELAAGREPLPQILKVAQQLGPGQVLHLRSPFRPSPLSSRLGHLGFASHSFCFGDDDWSTWFWKADTPLRAPAVTVEVAPAPSGVIDLRLLPPPEPLLVILERVEQSRDSFDVLLPFFPEPLVALLEPAGRRVTLVESRADGVQVRIEGRGER